MISYIIILICSLLLLLLIPIDSFYITNAATLEQCSTQQTMTYFDKFNPTKMICIDQTWRHTFISLEYSCTQNELTRIWTIKTNIVKSSNWPSKISLMTGNEYTSFDKFFPKSDPDIEEHSKTFDPNNNNQLTTYLWTSLKIGPQCRIKYTIIKDICKQKPQGIGAKLTDLICYYGKQTFNLQMLDQRQALDKLLDEGRKSGSNTAGNNPSNINNKNSSQLIPTNLPSNPLALNSEKSSFWKKYKKYIIIGGIILVIIIIIIIIIIITRIRRSQLSDKNIEEHISNESTIE